MPIKELAQGFLESITAVRWPRTKEMHENQLSSNTSISALIKFKGIFMMGVLYTLIFNIYK